MPAMDRLETLFVVSIVPNLASHTRPEERGQSG